MRNSRHVDVRARSLRSDELRSFLRDQTQECDEQIAELQERIQTRKRLAVTAPLPTSHRLQVSSNKSKNSASKSLLFETHRSDSGDVGSDGTGRHRSRSHSYHSDHDPGDEYSWRQQRSQTTREILKASAASPPPPERPQSAAHAKQQQRGILKKSHETRSEQPPARESPEAWFQRIMRVKQLSPLDLCDLFSFGDARKHATVPLSHVCEVLFDLDPEVRTRGFDPVTPEMEDFLYQFSFEGSSDTARGDAADASEIVVNIKDALRSLNIWQSGVTSPVKTQSTAASTQRPTESASPAKAAVLEAKTKKLHEVISSLQDANLRLSQQLDSAASTAASQASRRRTVPSSFASTSSSLASSWLSHSDGSDSLKPTLHSTSKTVNGYEDALVAIAHRLQYSGVKQLEELLVKSEALSSSSSSSRAGGSADASSGFVSLKQLRWLLSEHFGLDVRETELMESCLGMNFNARAQLDHREFTHVLLDILLYAPPHASAAKAQLLFATIRQYMASGFDARDDARNHKMLAALCAKYDLERDACVSVTELMRVLYTDLPKRHALRVAFPLTQQDALRIIQPFVLEHSRDAGTRLGGAHATAASAAPKPMFVSYPALLAAVFTLPGNDSEVDSLDTAALAMQALDTHFWVQLRKALCSGNRALEPSIHAQLCKIFRKIDPKRQYVVTQRTFARILDQHLSAEQLRVVYAALVLPLEASSHHGANRRYLHGREQPVATLGSDTHGGHHGPPRGQEDVASAPLRFDVFMKLVFGAPALQDTTFFRERIVSALQQHEAVIRARVVALLKAHGGGHEMTPRTLYDLVIGHDTCQTKASKDSVPTTSDSVLTPCELFYVFATLDDAHEGHVTLRTLWTFLKTECWRACDAPRHAARHSARLRPTNDGAEGRDALVETAKALAQCLDAYNLERALAHYKRDQHGSISQDQLLKEIYRMLHALGQDDAADALDPARLQQLLASIAAEVHDLDADLAASRRLHLTIPVDAFFDALVDWDALVRALQLPHNLASVKRALEVFDWSSDGTIAVSDWPKAWRTVSARSKVMAEWEVRALQRQFPAASGTAPRRSRQGVSSKAKRSWSRDHPSDSDSDSDAAINYAQLLVHLMDRQHEHARRRMQTLVTDHFRALGALSHRQIEQLYRRIDVADKGHINLSDLQQYVGVHVLEKTPRSGDSSDESGDRALVQNVNVMSSVLQLLASNSARSNDTGAARATTVTRSHFHSFIERLAAPSSPTQRVRGNRSSSSTHRTSKRGRPGPWRLDSTGIEDSDDAGKPSALRRAPQPQVLTSLRALELVILDICSAVARAPDGGILPTKAFRYLSTGITDGRDEGQGASRSPRSPMRSASRTSSRSPVRQQGLHRSAGRSRSPVSSMALRSQYRDVEAMRLDPLTPTTLQRVLLECHGLDASHMLVTQFFEHIGARSKRLLELVVFAKWVAPLSVAMVATVRTAVKQMVMRGKGGGGRVDLDRFFAQLQRKLLDAPLLDRDDDDAMAVRFAPLPLLQTALQQLGVPLRRVDLETLVRHVGMEEETGAIDVALFLQRLVDVSEASSTT